LAFWDNGFKQMSANKPLRLPADFKGLQVRIQPSKVLEAQMKALGANPVPMALSEVHAALRDGVVGGTENLLPDFYARKLHEVQKHLTLSDHGYIGYAVIVNKKFWQGLPADIRGLLEKAMRETTEHERAIAQTQHDQALEKLRTAGTTQIHILTAQERVAWRKQLTAIHKDFRERVGKDTIARINKIAAEVEKESKAKRR
jgi:C4-dicarboxylate-binding protein DctP